MFKIAKSMDRRIEPQFSNVSVYLFSLKFFHIITYTYYLKRDLCSQNIWAREMASPPIKFLPIFNKNSYPISYNKSKVWLSKPILYVFYVLKSYLMHWKLLKVLISYKHTYLQFIQRRFVSKEEHCPV